MFTQYDYYLICHNNNTSTNDLLLLTVTPKYILIYLLTPYSDGTVPAALVRVQIIVRTNHYSYAFKYSVNNIWHRGVK